MLLLAVESRLVCATMNELGMDTTDGKPTKNLFEKGTFFSKRTCSKDVYIRKLAACIVDKYIMNTQASKDIITQALNDKEQEALKNRRRLPNGRFPCRSTNCEKTFK